MIPAPGISWWENGGKTPFSCLPPGTLKMCPCGKGLHVRIRQHDMHLFTLLSGRPQSGCKAGKIVSIFPRPRKLSLWGQLSQVASMRMKLGRKEISQG